MLTVTYNTSSQLIQTLRNPRPAVMAVLKTVVTGLTIKLQRHIVKEKLSGQVLNVRSGKLRRSILFGVETSTDAVIGRVYSSGVPYAGIHEHGGVTRAHVIEAKKGKALAFMGSGGMVFRRKVNHPGSKIPMRSYMRSSLLDMQNEIRASVLQAVVKGSVGQ